METYKGLQIRQSGRISGVIGGLLLIALLSGCGSDGGGGVSEEAQPDPSPQISPAEGIWNQMVWGQGHWE